jgi:hypothetical protein
MLHPDRNERPGHHPMSGSLRTALLLFLLTSWFSLPATAATLQRTNTVPVAARRADRQERHQKQIEEFLRRHSDASGNPRPDLWRKAIEDAKRMKVATNTVPSPVGPAPKIVVGTQWTQIGPAPLRIDDSQYQGSGPDSGEVTDIAIDPRGSSDQVIYICANDGGIWKSTDGGASWQPKTDSMPSLSMGAVALDPGNPSIVYAGTGNYFNNGFFKGVGIYRSENGGDTWTIPAGSSVLTNQPANSYTLINRIVVPAPGVLLVGTYTFNTAGGGITGGNLFKSIDGGDHFGNNPAFDNRQPIISGPIADIDLDTLTPGTVYTCVKSVGLFKSIDYGSTFGPSLFDSHVPSAFSYLTFAQSRTPDNQTMYVNLQVQPGQARIFKSINLGSSWFELTNGSATSTNLYNGQINNCQCGYDQTIGVDPLDANRVYLAFQQLFESTDGGTSFPEISGNGSTDKIHWDHHAMVFSPHLPVSPPTRVYLGTDGGISYTTNDGASFANINESIATCLFRGIDIGRGSANNRAYTYGGCQDTGTVEHRPEFPGADWHQSIDGDGGPVVVDPTNPLRVYGTDDSDYIYTSDGGRSWAHPGPGATGLPGDPSRAGYSLGLPLGIDPTSSSIVYVVSYVTTGPGVFVPRFYQSTDTGSSFALMKNFPANIVIQSLATVALDSNTLWAGFSDGTLRQTTNALAGGGSRWIPVNVNGAVSGLPIGAVAIDPGNTAEVFVVYQGFSQINPTSRTKHIFHTTTSGSSWTDISGTDGGDPSQNLPDIPLNAVVIDPGTTPHTIIVASDAGVMSSTDLGATWHLLGFGLPTVECTSLALDAGPALLRVGTYGRSAFEFGFGALGFVWVAFGGTDPGIGTYERPYNTMALGVAAVTAGGTILIKAPGSTPETSTISKPMTILSIGGPATIGH